MRQAADCMMNLINQTVKTYLGLGTNQGDRQANLETAIQAMPPEVVVLQTSPVYQTPPWGYTDQPDFLNQVLLAETILSPLDLLVYVKQIEEKIGRKKTFRWGPREIDIDILDYGSQVHELDGLTLPHPRMHQRSFVLVPLAKIAPGWIHPVLDQSIDALLAQLDPTQIEIYQGA
jgi:2-amino-4-hydroxy-6-hydroxymethyldihydropteridine diphosphokinase